MARLELIVDAHSKCGVNRDTNEDCVGVGSWISSQETKDEFTGNFMLSKDQHLFLIADGIGGHDNGEVASRLAVHLMATAFLNESNFQINSVISEVHTKLTIDGRHSARPMGTTIVGLILGKNEATFFNIGDSKGYEIINNSIQQVTSDDRSNPSNRNLINNCLGGGLSLPKPNIFKRSFTDERGFLLASDGITNWLKEEDIYRIITKKHEGSSERLCEKAIESGSGDDVSAIVIKWNV